MIGGIFYAVGLILVISLSTWIAKFSQIDSVFEWFIKYQTVTGTKPKDELFRSKEELSIYQSRLILNLFEFSWLVLGLLTSNWAIFLSLIFYSLFIKWIVGFFEFKTLGKILRWHLILVKLITIFFLIINHFHLHLDITGIIRSHL